jgi:hypothetical protein
MQKKHAHQGGHQVLRVVYYNASSLLRLLSFVGLKARHAERIVLQTLRRLRDYQAHREGDVRLLERPNHTSAVELPWCAHCSQRNGAISCKKGFDYRRAGKFSNICIRFLG